MGLAISHGYQQLPGLKKNNNKTKKRGHTNAHARAHIHTQAHTHTHTLIHTHTYIVIRNHIFFLVLEGADVPAFWRHTVNVHPSVFRAKFDIDLAFIDSIMFGFGQTNGWTNWCVNRNNDFDFKEKLIPILIIFL